jgi:DNA-binding NarL/FixJ family response regulator
MKNKNEIIIELNKKLKKVSDSISFNDLPEADPESAYISGRRVVMVDDSPRIITHYFPHLMSATEGRADFVYHLRQSQEELIKEIKDIGPEVILLDANLGRGVKGYNIVDKIKKEVPSVIVLGFSSDDFTEELFLQAGAVGFVWKISDNPRQVIKKVALVLKLANV